MGRSRKTVAGTGAENENAAKVSWRHLLKTKGPVTLVTGPTIAGEGFDKADRPINNVVLAYRIIATLGYAPAPGD